MELVEKAAALGKGGREGGSALVDTRPEGRGGGDGDGGGGGAGRGVKGEAEALEIGRAHV